MADKNMFLFSTVAQVNYLSQIGRLIAEKNYKDGKRLPKLESKGDENNNTLCVILATTYGQYADLMPSVRRAWRINIEAFNRQNIKYVFAIYENVIVGIYELIDHNGVVESYEESRYEFNLQIANLNMQSQWLGVRLNGNSLRGSEFHYAYFNDKDLSK